MDHLDILDRNTQMRRRLAQPDVAADLRAMGEQLIASTIDKVTGMQSRHALDEGLDELNAKGIEHSIAYMDLRNLGGINKHFEILYPEKGSHEEANRVLHQLANNCIQSTARGEGGEAFRTGGDEFVAVFPGKNAAQVRAIMDTMTAKIAEVVKQHGLENTPHPKHDGLPTGAGYVDYGVAHSMVYRDRHSLLSAADKKAAMEKANSLERISIREFEKGNIWDMDPESKVYKRITQRKELDYGMGTREEIEGRRVSRDATGADRVGNEKQRPGHPSPGGGDGRVEQEKGEAERDTAAKQSESVKRIVEGLVVYAQTRSLTVPPKTQERWATLISSGDKPSSIKEYIDNYRVLKAQEKTVPVMAGEGKTELKQEAVRTNRNDGMSI